MQELFSQALTRLVELGQLSPKHVKKASGPVEELVKSLIDGKQLDRVTWLALLSKMTGCKALDLAAFRISPTQAQSITRRVAEDLHLLPIAREDSKLLVAMADPTNVFSLHRVMTLTGLECEPRLVYHVDLQSAIEQAFSVKVDRITAETPTRPKEPEAGGESKTRFMVATRVAPYGGDLNLRMQMVQDLGVSKKVKLEGFVTSRVQPVGIPTSQEESSAMLEQNLLHLLEPSSERERLESILALADRLVRVEGSSLLLLSEDGKQLC
ncbi:hypothetical protein DYH09_12950, partial [bacterium CPR1]|nr:hypothetical protein [bacterium CPR1]